MAISGGKSSLTLKGSVTSANLSNSISMRANKYIPEGYQSLTPYLIVWNASKAIDFYKQVFGAEQLMRMDAPGGKVGHVELNIGGSKLMLADEFPEMGAHSPQHFGGTPVSLLLYVPDADTVTQRAVAAGAKVLKPIKDQFYGDRSATITDPFGHQWTIATHIEDVSTEEMERRAAAMHNIA
jgi:PhnB protein